MNVSPELFFQTVNAYQRTAVLKTAIELDVFSALAGDGGTAEEVASKCATSVRGTRVLCDVLTVFGFLEKSGSAYRLTPDSAMFLVRQSPAYLGGTVEFLASDRIVQNFEGLTSAVRKGTVPDDSNTVTVENPVWEKFARAMLPMMAMPAQAIAGILGASGNGPLKVLDIAAGHGIFGIAIAQQNPQAEVFAVDWPKVVAVASGNAAAMGVGARHHAIPGDAFTVDWGAGYDVALVTNFLHHFDAETCVAFLRRVHAALAPGGRIAVLEFVPNEDRVSPPIPAAFALLMLAGTASGDAYPMTELTKMLEDAGFRDVGRHALDGPQTVVTATR